MGINRRPGLRSPYLLRGCRGLIEETKVQVITISAEIGREALAASRQFGKGRHRAALNFGDCFAYGCPKTYRLPLLFKGDDFPHTDIGIA
jgi:ribonuclease VapC